MPTETTWSLQDDLQKLSTKTSMSDSLAALGIISTPEDQYRLQLPSTGWYRAGAETYIYPFSVLAKDERTNLILKACASFSLAQPLDNILQSWIGRRELLALNGISTPRLYGWGHGILLEEEIPFTFEKALNVKHDDQEKLLTDAARLAGIVTRLGFQPISLFNDLRSRGNDIVMVDFGQDLGPSSNVSFIPSEGVFQDLLKNLSSWNIPLNHSMEASLRNAFLCELNF